MLKMMFFWISSCIVLGLVPGLVVLFFCQAYWTWRHDFRHRVPRDHASSPSNPKRPRQRKPLDMDHVYISFLDYLWVSIFVGLSVTFQWAHGLLVLKFREKLLKKGWIRIQQPDYGALVAQLALGSNFAVHFTRFIEEYDDQIVQEEYHDIVAEFFIEDHLYVINNSQAGSKEELEMKQENFQILIKLERSEEEHRLLKAWIGEKEMTAQETYLMMTSQLITTGHVTTHALANWGINPQNEENPFFRRMSVISVMYNYYGLTMFNRVVLYLQIFCKPFNHIHKKIKGLVPSKFDLESTKGQSAQKARLLGHMYLLKKGIDNGVKPHAESIRVLMPYSNFITFIVKVRKFFGEEFKRHENDFPSIDPEALFIGTVMHSLDHTQVKNIMKDPLWFRSSNLKPQDNDPYQWMEEFCHYVRYCFIDDLPGLLFNYRFKDSPHPFFKNVYNFAYKLNPELADNMDCCIIK